MQNSVDGRDEKDLTKKEEEEEEEVVVVSWSNLCQPILELILSSLTAISDYIRFGSVCSSWRQAQQSRYVHPNTDRFPWLIHHHNTTTPSSLAIFTHSGRSVKLDLPRTTQNMIICGSGHGWLLLAKHVMFAGGEQAQRFSLLNPITDSLIHLPTRRISKRTPFGEKTPALISAPPTDPSCVVVLISDNTLVFCRPGVDKEWFATGHGEVPYQYPNPLVRNTDMAACNGWVYVLTVDGRLGALGATSNGGGRPELTWLINENRGSWLWPGETGCGACYSRSLVESLGELLMVLGYHQPLSFEIYKADLVKRTWLRVRNIGDRALFLGRLCSLSVTAPPASSGGIHSGDNITVYLGYPEADQDDDDREWFAPWNQLLRTWKTAIPNFSWYWMQPTI